MILDPGTWNLSSCYGLSKSIHKFICYKRYDSVYKIIKQISLNQLKFDRCHHGKVVLTPAKYGDMYMIFSLHMCPLFAIHQHQLIGPWEIWQ